MWGADALYGVVAPLDALGQAVLVGLVVVLAVVVAQALRCLRFACGELALLCVLVGAVQFLAVAYWLYVATLELEHPNSAVAASASAVVGNLTLHALRVSGFLDSAHNEQDLALLAGSNLLSANISALQPVSPEIVPQLDGVAEKLRPQPRFLLLLERGYDTLAVAKVWSMVRVLTSGTTEFATNVEIHADDTTDSGTATERALLSALRSSENFRNPHRYEQDVTSVAGNSTFDAVLLFGIPEGGTACSLDELSPPLDGRLSSNRSKLLQLAQKLAANARILNKSTQLVVSAFGSRSEELVSAFSRTMQVPATTKESTKTDTRTLACAAADHPWRPWLAQFKETGTTNSKGWGWRVWNKARSVGHQSWLVARCLASVGTGTFSNVVAGPRNVSSALSLHGDNSIHDHDDLTAREHSTQEVETEKVVLPNAVGLTEWGRHIWASAVDALGAASLCTQQGPENEGERLVESATADDLNAECLVQSDLVCSSPWWAASRTWCIDTPVSAANECHVVPSGSVGDGFINSLSLFASSAHHGIDTVDSAPDDPALVEDTSRSPEDYGIKDVHEFCSSSCWVDALVLEKANPFSPSCNAIFEPTALTKSLASAFSVFCRPVQSTYTTVVKSPLLLCEDINAHLQSSEFEANCHQSVTLLTASSRGVDSFALGFAVSVAVLQNHQQHVGNVLLGETMAEVDPKTLADVAAAAATEAWEGCRADVRAADAAAAAAQTQATECEQRAQALGRTAAMASEQLADLTAVLEEERNDKARREE